jgi:hypothetical protein
MPKLRFQMPKLSFQMPVVDKSRTSCYHLVTRLMRPTDSRQVCFNKSDIVCT